MEVPDIDNAMQMLTIRRVQFVLGDQTTIYETLNRNNLNPDAYQIEPIRSDPLYMGFTFDNEGHAMAKRFEKGLINIHKSGELKGIYREYGYEEYYKFLEAYLPPISK